MAAERDESQAIIQRLYIYIYGSSGTNLGSSMNTNVTSDVEKIQCDICAIDVVENNITYEAEMQWYRLSFSDYSSGTARPPG